MKVRSNSKWNALYPKTYGSSPVYSTYPESLFVARSTAAGMRNINPRGTKIKEHTPQIPALIIASQSQPIARK